MLSGGGRVVGSVSSQQPSYQPPLSVAVAGAAAAALSFGIGKENAFPTQNGLSFQFSRDVESAGHSLMAAAKPTKGTGTPALAGPHANPNAGTGTGPAPAPVRRPPPIQC
jgi:hypothetical protein